MWVNDINSDFEKSWKMGKCKENEETHSLLNSIVGLWYEKESLMQV